MTLSLNPHHRRHLVEDRGLTEATIVAARLFSHMRGVGIPYLDAKGRCSITSVRLDHPKPGLPKYLRPVGAENQLYVPPTVPDEVWQGIGIITLTEGEFKALYAVQCGLAGFAVPGVWAWKSRDINNNSRPIADLDRIAWIGRTVELAFDFDEKPQTRRNVRLALTALAAELYQRGAGAVIEVQLPFRDGVKGALDDFLRAEGVAAYRSLPRTLLTNPFPDQLGHYDAEERLSIRIEGAAPDDAVWPDLILLKFALDHTGAALWPDVFTPESEASMSA